jgi:hypothetical protein
VLKKKPYERKAAQGQMAIMIPSIVIPDNIPVLRFLRLSM